MRRILFLQALSLIVVVVQSVTANDSIVEFNRDVRPILSEHCFSCHGPDEGNREADLRLDVVDAVGDDAVIVAGDPVNSEVWKRIISSDPDEMMPPPGAEKHLSAAEKSTLNRWIEQGAKYQSHWAFVTPSKPDVPAIQGVYNPIDAFVRQRLSEEGLRPAPSASREELIRRLTLDLTGLPPTLEEIDAFLADEDDDAYDKLVDRLQSSVAYGEHMARYWLDLARYADTHGLHLDNERSMWPYRDWVVRAFRENLSFDEFTRWQLAGDLLPAPTRNQLIASGFNRCNVSTGEGGSINKEWIFRYAVDRTATMSEVWMGLTAGCAVCHDHKFDPLSTKEFYSLYAFFYSAADPAMDGNKLDTPPVLRLTEPEDERRVAELTQQIDKTEQAIQKAVAAWDYHEPTDGTQQQDPKRSWNAWIGQDKAARDKALSADLRKLVADKEAGSWSAETTDKVLRHWLRSISELGADAWKPLEAKKKKLQDEKTAVEKAVPVTMIMADLKKPRDSFVMLRGAYDRPGDQVDRSVPQFLPPLERPSETDLNRLDLANWLVRRDHPLTSRVTVNRIWQQFFGIGLVETAEDFGTQGQLPSHPRLLDWLAIQFMDDGWDMKRLVRRIVTSQTYRQSSRRTAELTAKDPHNRLLARGPRLRLEAEVLRDQALFVSGLLVTTTGGKGVNPYQPPNIWEPVGFGSSNTRYYKQGKGDDLYRRSIYTFLKRTAPPPFMSTFDAPNREQSCSRRGRSNTPLQALQLMNDIQHVEAARNFAQRILQEGGPDQARRVQWAWRTVTARFPTETEHQVALQALQLHLKRYGEDLESAKKLVEYGESEPDNEMPPDELAAYTMLANLILNLDESVSKN